MTVNTPDITGWRLVADQLHDECRRRPGTGWSTSGTASASRDHWLTGSMWTGQQWDLIEMCVNRNGPAGSWNVGAHRWTTQAGWAARRFVTLSWDSDPRWSVVDAFDHADRLLALYVAQAADGELPTAGPRPRVGADHRGPRDLREGRRHAAAGTGPAPAAGAR